MYRVVAAILVAACVGCGEDDGPAGSTMNPSSDSDGGGQGGSSGGSNGSPNTPGSNGAGDDASAPADPRACPSADKLADSTALHAGAAQVLTSPATCALSVCHDSDRPEANLALASLGNLREALVDKPACQVPALLLVDGKGGDAALENSWLWQKLTAPVDSSGVVEENPSWGASATCKQQPGQTFGVRMPIGATTLAEEKLAKVRDWICAGAPAP